jgi:hypothetical protein
MIGNKSTSSRFFLLYSVSLFLYFINIKLNWPMFQISNNRGSDFMDQKGILDAIQCYEEVGKKIYGNSESCGSNFIYGLGLLELLSITELDPNQNFIIGVISGVVLLLILSFVVGKIKLNLKRTALSILLLFSPGPLLLLERGNFDIWMLILLLASVLFLNSQKYFLAFLLIIISATFKFYTLPVALLVIFRLSGLKKVCAIAIFIITGIFLTYNYGLIETLPSSFMYSFGSTVLVNYLQIANIHFSSLQSILIGTFSLTLSCFVVNNSKYYKRLEIKKMSAYLGDSSNSISRDLTLIFGFLFLSCFIVGANYDYRLIFLAIAVVGGLGINVEQSKFIQALLSLSVASLYFSCFSFGLKSTRAFVGIQFIGDIATLVLVAIVLVTLSIEMRLPFPSRHSKVTQ